MKRLLLEGTIFIAAIIVIEIVKSKCLSDNKEPEVRFESYVFFDERSVLHTDSNCEGLKNATQYQDAEWKSLWNLSPLDIEKMCSRCVTDDQSEKLRSLYK